MKHKPLLVTGSHRSGTTWIGKVLEKSDIYHYYEEPMNLEETKDRLGIFQYWFQYIKEAEKNLYNPLLDLDKKSQNKSALYKDPIAFFSIDIFINKINSNVLISIRNPFSFVSSLKRLGWTFDFNHFLNQQELMEEYLADYKYEIVEYSKNEKDIIDQAILLWNIFYSCALKFKKKYPEIYLVKHENLSLDPFLEFEKICDNFNIPFSEKMKEYIKQTTSNENSSEAKDNRVHQLERNSKENIYNYKKRLSNYEIIRIYKKTKYIFDLFYDENDYIDNLKNSMEIAKLEEIMYKKYTKSFIVSKDTDLVIEGFPRSSNTFVVRFINYLLNQINIPPEKRKIKIAHHIHTVDNLRLALFYKTPVVILIRKPEDAILSHFIYKGDYSEESLKQIINWYKDFYTFVEKNIDKFIICDFSISTNNINLLIQKIRDTYSIKIPLSSNFDTDSDYLKNLIVKNSAKEKNKDDFIRTTGVKNKEREGIKNKYRTMIKEKITSDIDKVYAKLINSKNAIKNNKNNKKISIITPSFNNGDSIERAIISVLNQRYDNFEHIVIDGGSSDNTISILKKYPHLKWISEKDQGQADAMNKGFKMSTGDVIVYLNCDDFFLDNAFHNVIKNFEGDIKVVVGQVKLINNKGKSSIQDPNIELPKMLEHWKPNAFPYNPVQYFYEREVQELIPFRLSNNYAMDHEFLLEAAHKFKFKKISDILGVYRSLDGSKTVEGQKDAVSYWSYENFSYIDKFLTNYPKEYALNFKKEQFEFFLSKINRQNHNCKILKRYLGKLSSISFIRHPLKKFKLYKKLLNEYRDTNGRMS